VSGPTRIVGPAVAQCDNPLQIATRCDIFRNDSGNVPERSERRGVQTSLLPSVRMSASLKRGRTVRTLTGKGAKFGQIGQSSDAARTFIAAPHAEDRDESACGVRDPFASLASAYDLVHTARAIHLCAPALSEGRDRLASVVAGVLRTTRAIRRTPCARCVRTSRCSTFGQKRPNLPQKGRRTFR
jgi:hypothetical protein